MEGAEERKRRSRSEQRCLFVTSPPRRRKHNNNTCGCGCLLLRLLGGSFLLGGSLLLGLLGRLLQGLAELVAGLDLDELAGLDQVLELRGQDLLEVAGELEVGADVLADGGDGGAVPVLEGQDGGFHHVLVLGVGGGGFRGHLCGVGGGVVVDGCAEEWRMDAG